jgi:recombination protein RecA
MAKESVHESRSPELKKILKKYNVTLEPWSSSLAAVEFMETGVLDLDIAVGIGGLPCGRVIEIFGEPSGGKTVLTLKLMATAQRLYKLRSLFIDAEFATPNDWLEMHGVNLDMLDKILEKTKEEDDKEPREESAKNAVEPLCGEDILNLVEELLPIRKWAYVVIDSVPALMPRILLEKDIGEKVVAPYANMWTQALTKLIPVLARTKTILILVNQLRDTFNQFGPQQQTPGGHAIRFYSAVRISVDKKSASLKKSGDDIVGHTIALRVVKNKVAPPLKTAEFDINYTTGIDSLARIVANGLKFGVLSRAGAYYTATNLLPGYGDLRIQGQEAVVAMLRDDSKFCKEVVTSIKREAGLVE